MKRSPPLPVLLQAFALAAASCAAWEAQSGARLTLDGDVLSEGIRGVERRAYVPFADVASFLQATILTNSTKETQKVSFDTGSAGNTALGDGQGRGYVPLLTTHATATTPPTAFPPGLPTTSSSSSLCHRAPT